MANYYCENCGAKHSSIRDLTSNLCPRHPDGTPLGKHVLYEGSERDKYECRHCGAKYSSIREMTANYCPRHPDGAHKGRHSPAL